MKGVMFSLIMVFLTVTLITLITLQTSLVSHRREQLAIETRINSMNNLYESIVRDVKKSLNIISRRAMSVAFSNVSMRGYGLNEANETLVELILSGTLEGSPMKLMENATFPEWVDRIENVSLLKGFNTTIDVKNLVIKPYDSFNLEIDVDMYVNITDLQGVATLNRYTSAISIVDIEDLADPIYPLYTGGLGANTIKKSPFEGNYTQLLLSGDGNNGWIYGESVNVTWTDAVGVSDKAEKILVADHAELIASSTLNQFMGIVSDFGTSQTTKPYVNNTVDATKKISSGMNILVDGNSNKVWFIDNLIEDTENSYYHSSENGTSYLDRLEGRLYIDSKYSSQTDKTIGLESFVNKNYLWSAGITVIEDKTNVDYIYFSVNSPAVSKVKGLDENFRIDDEDNHQETYNVTELLTS